LLHAALDLASSLPGHFAAAGRFFKTTLVPGSAAAGRFFGAITANNAAEVCGVYAAAQTGAKMPRVQTP
jgi:hypothetical protein